MANEVYVKYLPLVDSTNRYVRDEAAALWSEAAGRSCVAVYAGMQTAGRGQRGNVWSSDQGKNLLLSILVRPGTALEVSNQFVLSQAVALSVHAALERHGIDTRLKWPNDIYVGNRKLAGILIELDYYGTHVEQAIIGIGLNINQDGFPPMDRVPVSMKMLQGKEYAVDDVLADVLGCFCGYYTAMLHGDGEIASEYGRLLFGIGEEHRFVDAGGFFDAVIEGVEPTGHLKLRRKDGTLSRYAFKEVELLL